MYKRQVISGDNPKTVSQIAVQAGIDNAESYVCLLYTSLHHRKLRVAGQKCRDLLLVFCRVDGAGGVHQPAARFQQLCRRIEDGRLRGQ